jgi:hypothetical protein
MKVNHRDAYVAGYLRGFLEHLRGQLTDVQSELLVSSVPDGTIERLGNAIASINVSLARASRIQEGKDQ